MKVEDDGETRRMFSRLWIYVSWHFTLRFLFGGYCIYHPFIGMVLFVGIGDAIYLLFFEIIDSDRARCFDVVGCRAWHVTR